MKEPDFSISVLGEPTIQVSAISEKKDVLNTSYVGDDQYILYDIAVTNGKSEVSLDRNNLIEKAGPRKKIYFEPAKVHAAMAGKTGMIVSLIHSQFVHVPIRLAISGRKRIDPRKELWRDVTEATGQPLLLQERRKRSRFPDKQRRGQESDEAKKA